MYRRANDIIPRHSSQDHVAGIAAVGERETPTRSAEQGCERCEDVAVYGKVIRWTSITVAAVELEYGSEGAEKAACRGGSALESCFVTSMMTVEVTLEVTPLSLASFGELQGSAIAS
jgi:hypothetical protein